MLACCLLAAAGLAVHHGATADANDRYPEPAEVAADYDAHVGQQIHLWGHVAAVHESSLTVTSGPLRIRVTYPPGAAGDRPADANVGELVQVYGTFEPARELAAERVVVSSDAGRQYMFVVSGLAALLTLGAFGRHWRPTVREPGFGRA